MTNTPTATATTVTERDFPADPAALSGIRKFIAGQAGDMDAADAAILAGSELAANAIVHGSSPGATITVTVTVSRDMIRVDVTDGDPAGVPCAGGADADAERGRGLQLVDALASRWGCNRTAESKTTWCEMPKSN